MTSELDQECAAWPADQAARWRAAFTRPGGWSPRTRRGCAYTWSRYLDHCRAEGLPERLSRAGVAGFARAASARGVKLNTFHTVSRQLHAVARIVEPESDTLAWLAARTRRSPSASAGSAAASTACWRARRRPIGFTPGRSIGSPT